MPSDLTGLSSHGIIPPMFVRLKSSPNSPRRSVQIVETKRVNGKPRQRVIRQLGTASEPDEIEALRNLGEFIIAKMKEQATPTLFGPELMAQIATASREEKNKPPALPVDLKQLREEHRVILGIHDIYGRVYDELGFSGVLGSRARRSRKVLRDIVLARIANPKSKRGSVEELEANFGCDLSLEQVYRMMDLVDEEVCGRIEIRAWESSRSLFGAERVNVLFFDCTTVYFESVQSDELRQKGYSKDGKGRQTQVLLALLVTEEGVPLGWRCFPGATWEGGTMVVAIDHIREHYEVGRVIVAADAGMFSQANLRMLEQSGAHYVVGARLKKLSKEVTEKVLDLEGYENMHTEEGMGWRDIRLGGNRRLIVYYSHKRARKDRHERVVALEKLKKKFSAAGNLKHLAASRGYARLLKISGEASVEIDEEKVSKDARWDGIGGIVTNELDRDALELVSHYRGLWQVEESFRITKHDLKVRPVYHWTQRRIKAHLAICFMALCCVRHLGVRIKRQKRRSMSAEVVRSQLCSRQVSVLSDIKTKKRYAIPSSITNEQRMIYHVMGEKLSDVPFSIERK